MLILSCQKTQILNVEYWVKLYIMDSCNTVAWNYWDQDQLNLIDFSPEYSTTSTRSIQRTQTQLLLLSEDILWLLALAIIVCNVLTEDSCFDGHKRICCYFLKRFNEDTSAAVVITGTTAITTITFWILELITFVSDN